MRDGHWEVSTNHKEEIKSVSKYCQQGTQLCKQGNIFELLSVTIKTRLNWPYYSTQNWRIFSENRLADLSAILPPNKPAHIST